MKVEIIDKNKDFLELNLLEKALKNALEIIKNINKIIMILDIFEVVKFVKIYLYSFGRSKPIISITDADITNVGIRVKMA